MQGICGVVYRVLVVDLTVERHSHEWRPNSASARNEGDKSGTTTRCPKLLRFVAEGRPGTVSVSACSIAVVSNMGAHIDAPCALGVPISILDATLMAVRAGEQEELAHTRVRRQFRAIVLAPANGNIVGECVTPPINV